MAIRDRPLRVAIVGTGSVPTPLSLRSAAATDCTLVLLYAVPLASPACRQPTCSQNVKHQTLQAGLSKLRSTCSIECVHSCLSPSAAATPPADNVRSTLLQSDSIGMDTASLSIKSDSDETFRVDVPMRSINGGESALLLLSLQANSRKPHPPFCARCRLSRKSPKAIPASRRAPRPIRLFLLVLAPRRPVFFLASATTTAPAVSPRCRRFRPRRGGCRRGANASSCLLGSDRVVEAAFPGRRFRLCL
jgi:hypothetical protein